MKPVQQTLFGSMKGNCFAACVASILEIDSPDDVPHFVFDHPDGEWFVAFKGWMLRHWRLDTLNVGPKPEDENKPAHEHSWHPLGWSIAIVKTARGEHALVCQDGKIVHNPDPYGKPSHDCPVIGWIVFLPTTDLLDDWIAHQHAGLTQ